MATSSRADGRLQSAAMDNADRDHFDRLLEQVLDALPEQVHQLLEEVPLLVEDYPADEVLASFDLAYRDDLCGLHDGIPLTDRSVEGSNDSGVPDHIVIYREGITTHAAGCAATATDEALCREIRITILHELGHHFGLDEDDLTRLGYG